MEDLALQSACFENIKTLCVNYKKDGASRKNEDYLTKRLQSLEEQWSDFNARHLVLEKNIQDKNISYFLEDTFNKTKSLYETTKTDMMHMLIAIRKPKDVTFDFPEAQDGGKDTNVNQLLTKQESNFKALDRAMSKIDLTITNEKWELEDHLSILKSKWDNIDRLHWELETLLQGSNESYYNRFVSIESKYDIMKRKLNSKIWSTVHYQKSAPKIDIPEFSGSYKHWISFKDLFLETIHNNPMINNAQKMQHLKTKLRGDAERLVQHLSICADNYHTCWDILNQRYDNRRLQFTTFMNTMLQLPVIQQPDGYNLKRLHDVITECLNGLSNIGLDTSTWDPLIVHLMSQKLDSTTLQEYIKELHDHREVPELQDFLHFLESKFLAYETIKPPRNEGSGQQQKSTNSNNKPNPSRKLNHDNKKPFSKIYHAVYGQCPLCNESHVLMQCPKFVDLNPIQRIKTVSKLNVCKNCLFSHGNANCTSTKTCKECNMKHHTLLHIPKKNNTTTNSGNESESQTSTSTAQQNSHHLSTEDVEVLLTTAQIRIKANNGAFITLRALLDQGSQVNLISEKAAQLLKLPRTRLNATISGIGSVSGDCKGRLQLTCKSIYSDYTFETEALVMRKITNNLPNSTFERSNWPHVENLKLADPEYNISRPVDLLLGADVFSQIILDGVLKGNLQSPIAQQTHLGWILCGKLKTFNCHVTLVNCNELTRFWDHEDIIENVKDTSQEDECETYYVQTTQRKPDGKYIVKMPLCRNFDGKLGQSKSIATSQFIQLEKRLKRKEQLAVMYRDFVKEYIDLGHMKPAAPLTNSNSECYLPHHGVIRESSTTTKLRVVFNASQKTSSGHSLNSVVEKGPNLQKDIQSLILKWRTYRYAFTADIEKMYRCIWISEEQQQLQKIIWRDSPYNKLQEYQLCTVTYGTKCAPWLAMRTLKQLASDDGHKFPAAAAILENEFYVDDLVSGHNSLNGAKLLQKSLIELLKGGGMNLRKWSTNHSYLLEDLNEDQISTNNTFDFKHEDSMKTLGLSWNCQTDNFTFNWNLEENDPSKLTKRYLLSEISKLYDPLGWLSPITVAAKLLFQRVWTSKLGWDDSLPTDIQNEWLKIKDELPLIKNIQLNRWIGGTQQDIELLCFCDASEKAYSCVIYTRVNNEHNLPCITLLAAKTRVAPLAQKTTLPRLELCGALLLAQLVKKTKEALTGHNVSILAWCDSQVVLAWIQGETSRWERYVANRVTKIKDVIPASQWRYIKSEQNPADCASRGLPPAKLVNFELWWQGPEFLRTNEQKEALDNSTCLLTTDTEAKKRKEPALASKGEHLINTLINKFSSLSRVQRVTAWILRFIRNARDKTKSDTDYLTTGELSAANERIIKFIQQTDFAYEYEQLEKNKTLTNKSKISKLYPYLDDKGLIRVGGRLNNSNLPAGMKNPIILSRSSRFTQLLIAHAHLCTLHGGARLTLAYIRQRYWIVGGNRAVKTELRHCIRCHRFKPTNNYQLMGDLPQQRTIPSQPFTHTGVDFTGHVEVKLNKGRGVRTTKGYVAIFVCMATKAVHIELVSDLSTETFIAAFQRMCSRRGTPKHVYSDCGTNFVGASKMLRNEFEEFKQILSPDFFTKIGKLEVEWHFNAPAWPSAGGLWEAAVKSFKHHLRRVLGEQKLTYEEFSTLLTKIEACMNSRPLCPLTEDPDEFYNYLTPGHFLTGGPTLTLPLSDYSDVTNIDIRRRWQLTENMVQQFWKHWSNEYLTQLQSRSKWNKPTKNLKEGDIVLVRDNNLPPGKWAVGRIQELHPGSDGLVRVTTVKTQAGTIKRPIVKLSPLPMQFTSEKQLDDLESNDNNSTPKDKKSLRKRPKRKCLSTLLLTLITMFTFLSTGSRCAAADQMTSGAQITSLEPERPIYYDTTGKVQVIHDKWILLMYYNLTNYWDGVQRIQTYLSGVKKLCDQTDPRYCKTTLEQLDNEMELLHYYNSILLSPHKHLSDRKKRGLVDGVGYIANSLFGILDQHFAEKYQKDIKHLQNNENYLLELIKNQTSIVELENQALRKKEDNINQQFQLIEGFMKHTDANFAKIESVLETVMATNYFNSASLTAYLLINNLRKVQEMLFDTLTDVYKGHINVHLLSPVALIKQMNDIAGKLPKSLSLPVDNVKTEIKNLYKLLYVKARVTDNFFLFEIHIPLISDEDFSLYRAIPLPIKTSTGTALAQLSSTYIAVNFGKNTYVLLSEEDLGRCVQLHTESFICNKNLPIFNLHNDNAPCEAKLLGQRSISPCEMRSAPCKDAWIELHHSNTWLAICCGTCILRTICNNDVTTHTITTSGILTLAKGCMLQSKDLTIHPHNQYNSKTNLDYDFNIPTINSTVNKIVHLTYYNKSSLFPSANKDIDTINQLLTSQKERERLPTEVSSDDVHQYIISYTALTAVTIIVIMWVLKKRKTYWCNQKQTRQGENQCENIELQAISKPKPHHQEIKGKAEHHADNITFNFEDN